MYSICYSKQRTWEALLYLRIVTGKDDHQKNCMVVVFTSMQRVLLFEPYSK